MGFIIQSSDKPLQIEKCLFPTDQLEICYTITNLISPDIASQALSQKSFSAPALKELAGIVAENTFVAEKCNSDPTLREGNKGIRDEAAFVHLKCLFSSLLCVSLGRIFESLQCTDTRNDLFHLCFLSVIAIFIDAKMACMCMLQQMPYIILVVLCVPKVLELN